MRRGAAIAARDARRRSPLAMAVHAGNAPGVQLAFERGATLANSDALGAVDEPSGGAIAQHHGARGDGRRLLHTAAAHGYRCAADARARPRQCDRPRQSNH